jgi:hypothetical protein
MINWWLLLASNSKNLSLHLSLVTIPDAEFAYDIDKKKNEAIIHNSL